MATNEDLLYYGIAGVGAAVGLGFGLYYLLNQSSTPPPPTCPTGDVPETDGSCPTGYEVDGANPGCCKPSGTGGLFEFGINGDTGLIVFACSCLCTEGDFAFEGLGASANGEVQFFVSEDGENWTSILDAGCNSPLSATADSNGEYALVASSSNLYYDQGTGNYPGFCSVNNGSSQTLYLIAYDVDSQTYSTTVAVQFNCGNCSPAGFCGELSCEDVC